MSKRRTLNLGRALHPCCQRCYYQHETVSRFHPNTTVYTTSVTDPKESSTRPKRAVSYCTFTIDSTYLARIIASVVAVMNGITVNRRYRHVRVQIQTMRSLVTFEYIRPVTCNITLLLSKYIRKPAPRHHCYSSYLVGYNNRIHSSRRNAQAFVH